MRTETDALLSLQRYVAAALPSMTEVLTELERGDPPARPFAIVSADDTLSTEGTLSTPWSVLPCTAHVYIDAASRKAARAEAEAIRDALWEALYIGIGDGRPLRVPLFDYTGKPATWAIDVTGATSGQWRLELDGDVSAPLELDAQPRALREALEALAGEGIVAGGRAGGPWWVRFDRAPLRGTPHTLAGLVGTLAGDDPDVAVEVLAVGDPEPWRTARDFVNVEQVQLGGLPDPSTPTMRTITAGVRLTWARGGRVPSAEMTLTGITARGR